LWQADPLFHDSYQTTKEFIVSKFNLNQNQKAKDKFFAYFPYFEKVKVDLQDHLAVCEPPTPTPITLNA
jgi:hypothetical protein